MPLFSSPQPTPHPRVPDGVLVSLPGRHALLPDVYQLRSHPSVAAAHGRIFLLLQDQSIEAMTALHALAATATMPQNREEIADKGFLILDPDQKDILLSRDINATGDVDPTKDVHRTWCRTKVERTADEIAQMEALRDRILGPAEEMTASKATFVDGSWRGGVALERSDRAVNIKDAPRCYPISVSIQPQRSDLEAPARGLKVYGHVMDDDLLLRQQILRTGAACILPGLEQGPPGLLERLTAHANMVNLPNVGVPHNVAYPAFQGNIAAAVEPGSRIQLDEDLGLAGALHADEGDALIPPTGMTHYSEYHPDVEEEFFSVSDGGIAWLMKSLLSVYFSGLQYHCGNVPIYKSVRTEPDHIYYRITLIAYPPGSMLNGTGAVAFAALPSPKNPVLTIGPEMRTPSSHKISEAVTCTQATFTADGGVLMSPKTHFNHFVRNVDQLVAYLVHQLPPQYVARFNRDVLISAFSMCLDGERVQADAWPLGPGWSGEDTHIGTTYPDNPIALLLQNPTKLAQLCNSDSLSDAPYGNEALKPIMDAWQQELRRTADSMPLCVTAESQDPQGPIGGRRQTRTGLTRRARNGNTGKPKKTKAKHVKKKGLVHIEVLQTDSASDEDGDVDMDDPDDEAEWLDEPRSRRAHIVENQDDDVAHASPIAAPLTCKSLFSLLNHLFTGSFTLFPGPFLAGLTEESLETLLETTRQAVEKQSHTPQSRKLVPSVDRSQEQLDRMDEVLADASSPRPERVNMVCEAFIAMTTEANPGVIVRALQHRRWMLLNVHLWEWLETNLRAGIAAFKGPSTAPHWLKSFVARVSSMLNVRMSATLDANAFFPSSFPHGKTIFHYEVVKQLRFPVISDEKLYSLSRDVLIQWFGFPDQAKYQQQAWFVRALVDNAGVDSLLLPSVSYSLQRLRVDVLGGSSRKAICRSDVEKWAHESLASHPLSTPGTPIWSLLDEIARLHDDQDDHRVIQKLLVYGQIPAPAPVASGVRSSPAVLRSSVSTRRQASCSNAVQSSPVVPQPSTSRSIRSVSANTSHAVPPQASLNTAPPPTPVPNTANFEKLIQQIEFLYPILDHPLVPIVPSPRSKTPVGKRDHLLTTFQAHVQSMADKQLPFRDHGPSRLRVLAPGGPFSPAHLSTPAGFFSALIERGVTHQTPFLQENPTLFENQQAWNRAYAKKKVLGKPADYFCRTTALGSSASARKVSNVKIYWKAVSEPRLIAWLTSPTPVKFMWLFKHLRDAKLEDGRKAFPAFGSLTAYLLTVDYARERKVEMPNLREMGKIIHEIAAGGKTGLQRMGFIHETEKQTIAAFINFYENLHYRLAPARRVQMGFGVFTAEHCLCKSDRLDTKLFKKLALACANLNDTD